MLFKERKKDTGYEYDTEDVFGTVHIESDTQLGPDILDGIVMLLLAQNVTAQTVTGEVVHSTGKVKYVFTKAPLWQEDKDDEPCNNTPTSTKVPADESVPTIGSRKRIWTVPGMSWLVRFAAAFLEAWRSASRR